MNSTYAKLIIALQSRLQPILNYIELDLGQLDVYDQRPAVAFPCGLLSFQGQYEQMQVKTQKNNFTLFIKLGWDVYGNTSSLVPLPARENALRYLEDEQDIYLKLQGWDADGLLCVPFRRVADGEGNGGDGIRRRILTLSGTFADASLSRATNA